MSSQFTTVKVRNVPHQGAQIWFVESFNRGAQPSIVEIVRDKRVTESLFDNNYLNIVQLSAREKVLLNRHFSIFTIPRLYIFTKEAANARYNRVGWKKKW